MNTELDTLRADLEAAITAEEKSTAPAPAPAPEAATAPAPTPEVKAPAASEKPTDPPTEGTAELTPKKPDAELKAPPTEPTENQGTPPLDVPPPQAWKAPLKAKWASIDPDVRQEIARREREILREFGVNGQARKIANDVQEVFRPYEARIRALGVTPLQAANELLRADHILSTAPTQQRAQYMAKLIKDYGVDIAALDSALSGEAPDPTTSSIERMFEQRLAPLQQFVARQQQQLQAQAEARKESAADAITRMSEDTVKYPYFEDVREDMADLIEVAAKRGTTLSLEDAYTRATRMNPEVSAMLANQQAASTQQQQAAKQQQAAQKALNASASVKGAPAGAPSGSGDDSLRGTIEAAFAQVQGR